MISGRESKERGKFIARYLDDKIDRIHKEGGGEKEEEGSKADTDGGNNDTGEGKEREGGASLEDASNDGDICGGNASGQATTTTNDKYDTRDDDDK